MARDIPLAHSNHLAHTASYERFAPKQLAGFQGFASSVFAEGALSVKTKELIAVGIAHVLRCPYCIEYHIGLAQQAGAYKQEIGEAIWVGIALSAGAAFAHTGIAMKSLSDAKDVGSYYEHDNDEFVEKFVILNPKIYAAYVDYAHASLAAGALSAETKELIAVACAHNTQCAFCIAHHTKRAKDMGHDDASIAEAIWVAVEMAAGASFGHAGLSAAILDDSI